MARGIHSALARKQREDKWTLAKLQSLSPEKLLDLRISEAVVPVILGEGRPPITAVPTATLHSTVSRSVMSLSGFSCVILIPSHPQRRCPSLSFQSILFFSINLACV